MGDLTAGKTWSSGETVTAAALNASVVDAVIKAGALSADTTGRAKMADGFLTLPKMPDGFLSADAAGRAKMADGFLTLPKMPDGFLSADTAGRAKMSDGFLSADTAGRAKMADAFVTISKMATGAFFCRGIDIDNSYQTITATIPFDNTVPQNTEGTEVLSVPSFSPVSASHTLLLLGCVAYGHGSFGTGRTVALFRSGEANAIAARAHIAAGVNASLETVYFMHVESASSTSARSYSVRMGANSGNSYLNGTSTSAQMGGALMSYLMVFEIK